MAVYGCGPGWQRGFLARPVRAFWLVLLALLAAQRVDAAGADDQVASVASPFTICQDQTYALCATSRCTVFDGVAYCRCDVKQGDSISLSLRYAPGKNVCNANAQGVRNGYMISTFSVPPSVIKGVGNKALYSCPASTSNGAYAQCDGGYCFKSSRGQHFPGFRAPLRQDEIICSCPITKPDPASAKIGFQIVGPYPCQQSFFANCQSPPATGLTGSMIYVGAPTGVPRILARELNGRVPPLNTCVPAKGITSASVLQ
jgi:hypothetical protein